MKNTFKALSIVSALAMGATMASADGSVTVYTAVPQNFIDALVPMFEDKTGTSVEIIKAGSGELLNRLTAEADAPMADVLWSVDGTVIDFNPGLFEAYSAAARFAHEKGLGINAGHDLDLANLPLFGGLPHLDEVSIGHAFMSEALFLGLPEVLSRYLAVLAPHAKS